MSETCHFFLKGSVDDVFVVPLLGIVVALTFEGARFHRRGCRPRSGSKKKKTHSHNQPLSSSTSINHFSLHHLTPSLTSHTTLYSSIHPTKIHTHGPTIHQEYVQHRLISILTFQFQHFLYSLDFVFRHVSVGDPYLLAQTMK